MCLIKSVVFFLVYLIYLQITLVENRDEPHGMTIKNPVHFPYGGPFMGIFVAISIPIELSQTDLFLSYNFEANYNLPQNETEYDFPPIVNDRAFKTLSISRQKIYDAVEYNIMLHGYPGKPCLLRAICEAAGKTLDHNGLLGELLNLIFLPSTSSSEGLPLEYAEAEIYGKKKDHCKKYVKKCSISILNLISLIENY